MKKKTAAAALAFLVAAVVFFGGINDSLKAENTVASLTAESQETAQSEEGSQTENPELSVIDTAVSVQPGSKIAVVSKQTKGQYWSLVEEGMTQAVKDINAAYGFTGSDEISMTFEGASDESDVDSQINTLDAVIAENPAVVCISAGDEDSCQAQLEAARENGIPVVAFDSGVSADDMIWAFVGSDNQAIGETGAEKLAEAIGESGQIAVFSPQEKTQSARERTEAFAAYIQENYPDIEIVQTLYEDKVEDLAAAMQGVLNIYPDLAGVFCTNAEVSEMWLNLEKSEEKEAAIAFADLPAVPDREVGVISQQPYAIGYRTIWEAAQATFLGNTAAEKTHRVDSAWIDAENLDDAAYADYIY